MAGMTSGLGVLGRRSARIALITAVVVVLLFVGLLFLERSGPRPVRPVLFVNSSGVTTTVPPTTTTNTSGMGQNCNDNDQKVGEGTPADIAADADNGNGHGGDGCPSGI
jgi:hypothetical protein